MSTTPAYKGHQATTNSGLTSIPVNVPSSGGPAVGDWMLAVIHTTATNATLHNTAPPTDSGWVQVMAPGLLSSRILQIYAKRRTSTDPNTWTFTQEKTGTALADVIWGSGGPTDMNTWLKGAFSKGANLQTQTTPSLPGAVANSLAISIQAEATAATETDVMTVDSPFTKLYWTIVSGSNPVNSLLIATRTLPADGATGDAVSRGWPNSTGNRGSFMLVIPPAADAAPQQVARLDAQMADGAGGIIDVGLVGWDGSAEVPLNKVEFLHSGLFVPDLDRIGRVWTMGHRGGSVDYQEHTMRGYVECSINHIDVLEISVAITSDGKILCAHDATADRTSSAVRGQGWRFDQHTWADVQQLVQDLPNRGDPRFTTDRYYLLDEFIEKFSATHTLAVDVKNVNTANRRDVLYPRLRQITDYQRRVIGKFFHTGTIVADEFHSFGCKVWGYAYPEAITGLTTAGTPTTDPLLSATAPKWDYLGMEWSASQEVWTETLRIANGKRVVGHIVDSLARADEAYAKGARALQVSGVRAVQAKY